MENAPQNGNQQKNTNAKAGACFKLPPYLLIVVVSKKATSYRDYD
jgi:hypothetical protein